METLSQAWATVYAYRQLLGTLAMFFGPSLLSRGIRFIQARRHGQQGGLGAAPAEPPRSPFIPLIVGIHLVVAAYSLYLPGYDVFETHKLKIRAPNNLVRDQVLLAARIPPSADLEQYPLINALLARLSTLDGRYAYVRWGHATFITGLWCRDTIDYALAAIPRLLSPYIAEAFLIGVMGWQTVGGPGATERKERFRAAAGWALGAMLALDFGTRCMMDIRARPDGDCFHVSVNLRFGFLTAFSARHDPAHAPHDCAVPHDGSVRLLPAAAGRARRRGNDNPHPAGSNQYAAPGHACPAGDRAFTSDEPPRVRRAG